MLVLLPLQKMNTYLPERLYYWNKKEETLEKVLLKYGRELPTSTADRGLLYSVLLCCCACTYMSFQSSPFLLSGGWGPHNKNGGKKSKEYFVIVQSKGDSMYISILYICDENAFCVTLPFTCTMVQHSVFQCC